MTVKSIVLGGETLLWLNLITVDEGIENVYGKVFVPQAGIKPRSPDPYAVRADHSTQVSTTNDTEARGSISQQLFDQIYANGFELVKMRHEENYIPAMMVTAIFFMGRNTMVKTSKQYWFGIFKSFQVRKTKGELFISVRNVSFIYMT